MTEHVLFVVAHPDDVAYACGGTAWLLKERYQLHVVCASRGERGFSREPDPAVAARRTAEEEASCAMLGADLTFLGLIDGEIFPTPDACRTVARMIADLKPRAVFTHGPFEKPDHSAVFSIAYHALCVDQHQFDTELCLFWQIGGTYSLQIPPISVDISGVIERKKDLIRCHASHLRGDFTVDTVIERNRMLGEMNFAQYSEGFYTPFPMANRRWGRPAECGRILLGL